MSELNPEVSQEFADLVLGCLRQDPHQRPFVKELRKHKWFKAGRTNTYKETIQEINETLLRSYKQQKKSHKK